jgi:FtsH-binding integral membrane protein
MTGTPYTPSELGVRPSVQLSNQLLAGAFLWMGAGLLLTAGVSALVLINPALYRLAANLYLPIAIGTFIFAIVIQGVINRVSATAALGLFFAYAAALGLTVGIIVSLYTTGSVVSAFLSAAGMFGAAAIYGYTTKRSLIGIGPMLGMGVIGLIVASFVNLVLGSGPLGFIIAIIGVILFTVLTAYTVQRIAAGDYAAMTGSVEKASILAALHLYINFINIFLFLLRIFGSTRE